MRHLGHVPRTDAELALYHDKRLRALEQSSSTRIGSAVLVEIDGKPMVSIPGQDPFELKPPDPVTEDTTSGGHTARMHRADTASVVLVDDSGSAQVFPDDMFDSVSYGAAGIGTSLTDGSFTVTSGGMYTVVLRAQAASVFKSTTASGDSHTVTPLLYVNDVVREYGTPASSAVDGLSNPLGSTALFSRWTVRLSAADKIQVGYRNDRLMDASGTRHRIVGDAGGAKTFLLISPGP